jgi:hypothetical protein
MSCNSCKAGRCISTVDFCPTTLLITAGINAVEMSYLLECISIADELAADADERFTAKGLREYLLIMLFVGLIQCLRDRLRDQ